MSSRNDFRYPITKKLDKLDVLSGIVETFDVKGNSLRTINESTKVNGHAKNEKEQAVQLENIQANGEMHHTEKIHDIMAMGDSCKTIMRQSQVQEKNLMCMTVLEAVAENEHAPETYTNDQHITTTFKDNSAREEMVGAERLTLKYPTRKSIHTLNHNENCSGYLGLMKRLHICHIKACLFTGPGPPNRDVFYMDLKLMIS